jgi:hypothetical protein
MNKFNIIDKRPLVYFKSQTFNHYKKTDIFKELKKAIIEKNIEKSILWLTELHCSGCTKKIYNTLLKIYTININRENLYILKLLILKYKYFNNLKDNLNNRNNLEVRNYLHNLVFLLTVSGKKILPKLCKINNNDFNLKLLRNKLLTKNVKIIKKFTQKDDNKNILIPISEIYINLQNINKSKSLDNCIFWLSWIINYEKIFHNGNIKCSERFINNVKKIFWTDYVWIIWEIILTINKTKEIIYLFNLFKLNYSKSKKKYKINYIIFAFSIIINLHPKINFNYKLDNLNIKLRLKILKNINNQYFLINKNYKPIKNLQLEKKYIKNNKINKINKNKHKNNELDKHIINHSLAINSIIPLKKIIKNNEIYKNSNIKYKKIKINNIKNNIKKNIITKIIKIC